MSSNWDFESDSDEKFHLVTSFIYVDNYNKHYLSKE